MHDIVALERRGVPTVAFRTVPFAAEEVAQAEVLGLRDHPMIELPHPVQPVPAERIAALADDFVNAVVAALTRQEQPGGRDSAGQEVQDGGR